jgi:hypothetical protein
VGRHRTRSRAVPALAAGILASAVCTAGLVYRASDAAFTASTSASAAFTSGTVHLGVDASGSVLFNVAGLKPADTGQRCVNVTYTGNLPAAVRFYASSLTGTGGLYSYGVADYLAWTVTEGHGATGGATGDCTGFVADSVLFDPGPSDLGDFFVASHDFGSGVSSWAPSGAAPETRSYRLTYQLYDMDEVQGASASAVLTWEARNS